MKVNAIFKTLLKSIRGFIDDDCYSKASALSFYTLLSIVPILAVAFGIAKGFGFEEILKRQILETFYQQQYAEQAIKFAESALDNAHGSLIAGVGVLFLFWSSFGLLSNLERALNSIWKVDESRSFMQKFRDFLPILIFTPIFIVATSSFTYLIISKLVEYTLHSGFYNEIRPLIYFTYYGLLLLITWLFFTFIYLYIPHKKVPLLPCMMAGLVTAVSFQLLQWGYIHLQVYLTSYNAIYGSFAAIPLFLLWIQLSWLITLAGGELALQLTHRSHKEISTTTASEQELLLMIMLECYRGYFNRHQVQHVYDIANRLNIPLSLATTLVQKCINAKLLTEGEGHGLIPASDSSQIYLHEIIEAARPAPYEVNESEQLQQIKNYLKEWENSEISSDYNLSLQQLHIMLDQLRAKESYKEAPQK